MVSLTWLNVDSLCSAVHMPDERPVVDLSKVTFFEPFALVYLGMFLRYHNARGLRFEVVIPKGKRARDYLETQNFWDRFNFEPDADADPRLVRMTNATSLNDIVDIECRDSVADEIGWAVRDLLRKRRRHIPPDLVAELVAELVDNFAQHSGENLAVFMTQRYPRDRRLDVAIGDCGMGIRASLASKDTYGFLANRPHWEAAQIAFEPQVSRKHEGGTGLTDLRDTIISLGAHLVLATGDGYLQIGRDGQVRVGQMAYNLPGVQIEFSLFEPGR